MIMYTLETLKGINLSYDQAHQLTKEDVEKINDWKTFIENGRTDETAQVGDIIMYTDKQGNFYKEGHIEEVNKDSIYICGKPYVPFINKLKGSFSTNTSGGPWTSVTEKLNYIGKETKLFQDWGHGGARGNGAVQFEALVNVWECSVNETEFSTRTHDKFHVSIREDMKPGEYKYLLSKEATNQLAFRDDEEYENWLITFHGVEQKGMTENQKIVWTYKQQSKIIPLEDYLEIQHAIIDSDLANGCIQECKRIFEATSVTTYMPFQHTKIELVGVKRYLQAIKQKINIKK